MRRLVPLSVLLGACAVAPVPPSTAVPVPPAPIAAPAASLPEPPVTFATPPRLYEDSDSRIAPADLPVPGYHCHWISPGKRYCHSGMD